MNVITASGTYATFENAKKKLTKELGEKCRSCGNSQAWHDDGGPCRVPNFPMASVRWLIATTPDGKRFVPTVLGNEHVNLAHRGIMVIS